MPFEVASLRILTVVNEDELPAIEAAIEAAGWPVWRLGEADSAEALFARAGAELPSPFNVRPVSDWSAFKDSLWEAAHTTDASEIALIWRGVERMAGTNMAEFVEAAVALNAVSMQLNNPTSRGTARKLLYVVLAGRGANFPAL